MFYKSQFAVCFFFIVYLSSYIFPFIILIWSLSPLLQFLIHFSFNVLFALDTNTVSPTTPSSCYHQLVNVQWLPFVYRRYLKQNSQAEVLYLLNVYLIYMLHVFVTCSACHIYHLVIQVYFKYVLNFPPNAFLYTYIS